MDPEDIVWSVALAILRREAAVERYNINRLDVGSFEPSTSISRSPSARISIDIEAFTVREAGQRDVLEELIRKNGYPDRPMPSADDLRITFEQAERMMIAWAAVADAIHKREKIPK